VLPQGSVTTQLASACDLHPTLLDLAGVAAPDDPMAAGSSLLASRRGTAPEQRQAVMVFDEYGGTRMVRSNDWKYVTRAAGPTELYHLCEDPDERHNLADEPAQATRADELYGVLHDWFRAHSDPRLDAFDRRISGRGQLQPAGNGDTDAATYHEGLDEIRPGGGPSRASKG
jgi:choline-sulfatase